MCLSHEKNERKERCCLIDNRRKIFVSYKYKDTDVKPLPYTDQPTKCRDYVDFIENYLDIVEHVYKGEGSDEDLSDKSEDYIWSHLKDKLYDSSLTIVLISPNMKAPREWQRSQWIPWEISYSLREVTRNGRTSHSNAILGVILPNRAGLYTYYDENNLFPILRDNIKNGYIPTVNWINFICKPESYIERSILHEKYVTSCGIQPVKNL